MCLLFCNLINDKYKKKLFGVKSIFLLHILSTLNYLDFFVDAFLAGVLQADFAEVFVGAAILLADVLLEVFFVVEALSKEDVLFNKEEDLLLLELSC